VDVDEFEDKAKTIVEVEVKNISAMVKTVKDAKSKKHANLPGLSTRERERDEDIKHNPLALEALRNYIANMTLDKVEGKTRKINYEELIADILSDTMAFSI